MSKSPRPKRSNAGKPPARFGFEEDETASQQEEPNLIASSSMPQPEISTNGEESSNATIKVLGGSNTSTNKSLIDEQSIQEEIKRVEQDHELAKEELQLKLQLLTLEKEKIKRVNELNDELKELRSNPSRSVREDASDIASMDRTKKWVTETQSHADEKKSKEDPVPDRWMEKFVVRQAIKQDLPQFDGKAEDWLTFITQFRESSKRCSYTDYENMHRLQKALKGKARDSVKALLLTPTGVDDVIRELELLYGRPELVIRSILNQVRGMTAPKNAEQFIEFGAAIRNFVCSIKHMNCFNHLNNPMLLEEFVQKIPSFVKMSWGEVVAAKKGMVNLQDFADWTRKAGEILSYTTIPNTQPTNTQKNRVMTVTEDKDAKNKQNTCRVCELSSHRTPNCRKFFAMTPQKRIELAKSKKLCIHCLRDNHESSTCFRKMVCGVDGCSVQHHKLLHPRQEQETPARTVAAAATSATQTENVGHVATNITSHTVLLKILPIILTGPKGSMETYAFLDDGSTVTMIDEEVAETLGLEGNVKSLSVRWTGNVTQNHENSRAVAVKIKGDYNGAKEFHLKHVRTVPSLALPIQSVDVDELSRKWPHIDPSKITSRGYAHPKILIGADNASLITGRHFTSGPYNAPFMVKTKLGWCLYGQVPLERGNPENFSFHVTEVDELHELVKKSFSTEGFGVKIKSSSLGSREDEKSLQMMEKTTKRVPERWETGLLWRKDSHEAINSREMALKRLLSLEKRLEKDPELAQRYQANIDGYLEKGYLKELDANDESLPMNQCWYLPHFPVINPNKPGKVRLVFDAAAKAHGVSLNDLLMTGPDMMTSLSEILIKFRQRRVGFTGDIKEMFHQVNIRTEDNNHQRILWRNTPKEEIREFKLVVMTFGAVCSPSLAAYVKDRNAKEFAERYPAASNAIIERHYVDDYVDSCDTEAEAIQRAKEVAFIHKQGGFEIRNWVSNSSKFIRELSPEEAENKNMDLNGSSERVLGLHWDCKNDNFVFQVKLHKVSPEILQGRQMPTKREMLRVIMSVFDPLGFLGTYMVRSKIMMQEVWKQEISWDDEIKENLHAQWLDWINFLPQISEVKIPRCFSVFIPEAISIQLHTFCDASQEAFAAVTYLRVEYPNGIDVTFVCAKNRVAPLKPISIPRLELQGALMASRLTDVVTKTLDIKISEKFFWCDSKTVISWIKSSDKRFTQFVAWRVGEIRELTDSREWNWIPTAQNVADEATRSSGKCDMNPNSRWFNGPSFLKQDKCFWPKDNNPQRDELDYSHHPLAKLILMDYHKHGLHQGKVRLINEVRQKYWILGVRSAAQRTIRECQECKVRKASPREPLMGQIPEARYQYGGAPFSHCGIDYFGPMEIKIGRRHEKRYGVLFICLTTRAIHLELAESLSTKSAVLAIRRFMGRRGQPVAFYSDNGTNLRGAYKEIRRAILENISTDEIQQVLAVKGVDWRFNPPSSPHMGGGWERLIRSVKTALMVTLKEKYPTEEMLLTLLIEAENVVNSRPLTNVSVDKDDPEAITPNHFLLGRSSASQPWGTYTDDDLLQGWQAAQKLADEFWRRWLKEYLPTLAQRHKWNRRSPNLQEGDIVIVADSNEKRNTWPLGKIVQTFPGRDGTVRVVDVETTKGIYRRPAHKICVLQKKE
ncbi:uncharacterized protein LOC129809187 [Phlebotomus papatasi]|uniref:uncharacterized protein LOC129809187 n=1 Tax=Phlebotomus papatasi TaxID=29031 RepID=UPI002483CF4B|nr:uncharacterized protein LOC129809187 [Phlebotomus papatasi]